jgi:hypothetical protein
MKLSLRDVSDIGLFGLGGLLVAGAYQTVVIYMQKTSGGALETATEAIQHHDPKLLVLLLELEKRTKALDPVAFVRAVDAIDRLVFLRARLEQVVPQSGDRELAVDYMKCAETSMQRVVKEVEAVLPARGIVELQKLFIQVVEQLELHMHTIFVLTRETEYV